MWSLGVVLLFTALSVASPTPLANSNPVVNLGYAQFRGVTNATLKVSSWYGLNYAASPTGAGRWSAPTDIEKRNNYRNQSVYDATTSGPACYQQLLGWSLPPNLPQSEDCLLLNVHTPTNPVSSKLPVLFMIHGGGYAVGSAIGGYGDYITSVSKGQIIYIEIQYRLGAFGFLNSQTIRNNGTGNAGLLDQRSALGWVQRNIAAFGGDPSKVTINGGSAGGGSVTAQMQLFGGVSKPPFRAAIAEYPWWQTFHDETVYTKQYTDILSATKCANLACLRALPYKQLTAAFNSTAIAAYQQGGYGFGDFYFGPGVDGTVMKERPHSAFAAGRFSKVPYMVNHDAFEGFPFSNFSADTSTATLHSDLSRVWPAANSTFFSRLDAAYPTSAFTGPSYFPSSSSTNSSSSSGGNPFIAAANPNTTALGKVLSGAYPGYASAYATQNGYAFKRAQLFGDAFVSCATRATALAGTRYPAQMPVWKAVFNSGALVHGAIDYAFVGQSVGGVAGNPSAAQLKTEMSYLQAYSISFTTDLDPNTNVALGERPRWDQYGAKANVLYDNLTHFAQGPDLDDGSRCRLFADYADVIRS